MKILHVVLSLAPGGMENGLVNVAQRLHGHGFEIHVCCLETAGDYVDRLPRPDFVTTLDKPPGRSARTVLRLGREIRRLRPDLLHSHNFGPLIYSAVAASMVGGPPLLHGEHGQLVDRDLGPGRRLLRRCLYTRCRRVHTVSESLREHLVDMGFPARLITAVVNGVDHDKFTPAADVTVRAELGLAAGAKLIGIVGRLTPKKQHDLLIQAVGVLSRRHPGLHLLIVGDGPQRERLECVAAEQAPQRVFFVGFQEDTRPYYRALDLLVMPSLQEGLSNVLLECMACGVPALMHDACGVREVITDGADGWVGDLRTVEALVSAIDERLRDERGLRDAGGHARMTVIQRFTVERMVAGYAALYREVAGDRRNGETGRV